LAAFLLLAAFAQAGTPSAEFERGEAAYDRAEYARAIEILRPLLYPEIRLQTEGQVAKAHRMLGVAHLFEKQNDLAAQEFRKFLQLRPEYKFDVLLDPPQVVDFFNGVARDYEAELARIDARRKEAQREEKRQRDELARVRNGPTVVEKRFARNSFSINFIPFGAGQFQNGQRRKGWAFMLSESALAGVSVAAFVTNFATYGFRPRLPCQTPMMGVPTMVPCIKDRTNERRSRLLTDVQLVSGGLFFAVAAWGIADAILNFKPEVPITSGENDNGPVSAGLHLRLAPVVSQESFGAALAFRF
jgi:hypothetical protein